FEILKAQIRHYQPDVLWNQAMNFIPRTFLHEIRSSVRLIVGQHGRPAIELPEGDWSVYDLVVSSFPPTVDWFRKRDIPSELHRLGFDLRVLSRLPQRERDIPLSFVGSFFGVHTSRTALLELLARKLPLKIWGSTPHSGFFSG